MIKIDFEHYLINYGTHLYSEDDNYFIYNIILAGIAKKDIKLEDIREKDFLTVEIIIKDEIYPVKIIKLEKDIDHSEKILTKYTNGLLEIKIPKRFKISRKELTLK